MSFALFALVVGLTAAAVWIAVFIEGYLRLQSETAESVEKRQGRSTIHWIICLAWAFAVVPSLLGLLQVGRQGNADVAPLVSTRAETYLATLLSSLLLVLCCRLIIAHLRDVPATNIWHLGAFLAPWIAIQLISGINAGYVTGRQFVFYPVVALAFWLASPPLRVLRTVGLLASLTAGFSIAFALVSPLGLVNAGPAALMKTIIGHGPLLLAGPYGSANQLALSLALGAPCVLLLRSRATKILGLTLIGVALAWAAGRTSILAATVGLALYLLCRGRSARTRRAAGFTALFVGTLLVVVTPWYERNPGAFTSRGVIWIQSLADWHNHLWLGGGPSYYERTDLPFYLLSFKILNGHNLVVDSLERGGILGLTAVAAWLLVLALRSLEQARANIFPAVYVVTLIFVSWLEVPLNLSNLGHLGYVCWIPAAVICFTRDGPAASAHDLSAAAQGETLALASAQD